MEESSKYVLSRSNNIRCDNGICYSYHTRPITLVSYRD